ncbi:MAG: helix-turn-helix transcriptional regulator [Bacteroidetes bacterium]|nr:helix-turn-helix transcriptional regulator [Bacteroidota bacterium]
MSIAEQQEIKDYIDRHFHAGMSVTSLAKRFNKTVRTLQRHFQEVHRQTAKQYIQNKRMELARQLLAEHDVSIYTIAARLGYSSPSCFARAFTRHTGKSPRQYRHHNKPA